MGCRVAKTNRKQTHESPEAAGTAGFDDRLAELVQMCTDGRLDEAVLELSQWCRDADTPAEARVLLASLLARQGRLEDAVGALHTPGIDGVDSVDAAEGQMLLALLAALGRDTDAKPITHALYIACGDIQEVVDWLEAFEAPGLADLPPISEAAVLKLEEELAMQPALIDSLVFALQSEPDVQQIELLRRAGMRLVKRELEPEHVLAWHRGLALLAELAGNAQDARRWAQLALQGDPYNAQMALLLGRFDSDPSQASDADQALRRVARKHRDYPDVCESLIRRQQAQGKKRSAAKRLAAWLARQPESARAKQLGKELAA